MKRRVSKERRHREPGLVETGTESFAEHGLGAAYRAQLRKAMTGAPVNAQEYVSTPQGPFREEKGEARWYHEAKALVLEF